MFSVDNNIRVDLNNLLIQLRQHVSPKWYQFGEAIGVKKEILKRIAGCCSPQECIVEMLDHWLRNHTGKPTWREVAEVLNVIDLPNLAVDIERVYTTGIDYCPVYGTLFMLWYTYTPYRQTSCQRYYYS